MRKAEFCTMSGFVVQVSQTVSDRFRVLVVDDDRDTADSFKTLIELLATPAGNGSAAPTPTFGPFLVSSQGAVTPPHATSADVTDIRAKLRAVEPDMLDKISGVTTLLPATMAEFSTSPGALSLDFGLSVPIILSQVMETAYLADFKTAGTSP